MSQSLEKLAGNLEDKAFKYTTEVFKDKEFNLMRKKSVYPYHYMDSWEKFCYEKLLRDFREDSLIC